MIAPRERALISAATPPDRAPASAPTSAATPPDRAPAAIAPPPATRGPAIVAGPRARTLGRARAIATTAALAACAHTPPPRRGPNPAVRAEITSAETAERARQHDVARAHYQRAIDAAHDPDSIAFARHEYAETLISWGEAPEARAQLEVAVTARPADAAAWHDLGILRHHAGDDPGAIQALVRAEQLAPGDFRPRTALAALYWKRGDKPSAEREYRAMLALDLPERLRAKVEWALGELAKP